MKRTNKIWTKQEREWATKMNNWKIEDMRKLLDKIDSDPDAENRKVQQTCKYCHYSVRMVMHAFTDTECGKCNSPMTFSNSDTDSLCKRCATMLESCKHCGGEMN